MYFVFDLARFPTLPDHLLKLVDRVVLCSSELFDVSKSSRSEKSKTDIDKVSSSM